jgi:hypothetical protein
MNGKYKIRVMRKEEVAEIAVKWELQNIIEASKKLEIYQEEQN